MPLLKAHFRRIRFWWHLTVAYLKHYRWWFVSSALLLLIISFSIYRIIPLIIRNNIVTIGYVGSFTLENIPTTVLALVTDSLTTSAKDGKSQPSLASHWTISDDGKTYIVFLKDNLKWHDDSPVNARDISLAVSDVAITALNNKAIEFRLPSPISSFPQALDKPVFKTKSFYGTGKYRIVDIDQIDGIVKKLSLIPKDKNLPRVDIKFYPTQQQAINAVKIGDVRILNVNSAAEFINWPNLEVEKIVDTQEIVTIFYNNQDPLLSSKELRQALSFAINRVDLDGKVATGPIAPTSWAYNDNVKKHEYNASRAKELLSKSNSLTPSITLTITPGLENLARNIQKDWQDIGIKVELKFEKTVPHDFQALLVYNKLNPDPDQYSLWHSTQTRTNIARYKNVKIDKLLEDARMNQDDAKRQELYFDFQRFLLEDAPATFLYHPYKYQITYKNIKPLIAKLPK